jgi:hypothetical protein
MQEIGRLRYDYCLVCGKQQQVMHHFFSKAHASSLRYCWKNLIPLCNCCHFKLHKGYSDIQSTICYAMGEDWYEKLFKEKSKIIKPNQQYYLDVIERLKNERTNYI